MFPRVRARILHADGETGARCKSEARCSEDGHVMKLEAMLIKVKTRDFGRRTMIGLICQPGISSKSNINDESLYF